MLIFIDSYTRKHKCTKLAMLCISIYEKRTDISHVVLALRVIFEIVRKNNVVQTIVILSNILLQFEEKILEERQKLFSTTKKEFGY